MLDIVLLGTFQTEVVWILQSEEKLFEANKTISSCDSVLILMEMKFENLSSTITFR